MRINLKEAMKFVSAMNIKSTDRLFMLYLLGEGGTIVNQSYATMGKRLGCSARTLNRTVSTLKNKSIIEAEPSKTLGDPKIPDGLIGPNSYQFTQHIREEFQKII